MKRYFHLLTVCCAVLLMNSVFCPDSSARQRLVFGGGPAGGTFQVVANAVQVYKPVAELAEFTVKAEYSAGSTENLIKVDAGSMDFGVVYSGEVYQARNGTLKNHPGKYEKVMAVARLYGAPAQLVVRADSGISRVRDLKGKKVDVGNPGSGAFATCELFLGHLGLWDSMDRKTMGYNDAAAAFSNREVDAFWLFTAFPSGAILMATQTNDIRIIDLDTDAQLSGFYKKYPNFSKFSIPAGSYRGVDTDVPTFQDAALWVAGSGVSPDAVYRLLSLIFTEEGLKHMAGQKKTFREMSIANGIKDIVTPLHPGAEKFWREKGVLK
ncbi:MAG: TAXI family TRAP transporter solute-binding subunit [Desulfobacterales bacterium]